MTPRRPVEEELCWLAAIVESSDDAIISEDLDGLLTSWNPGAERIYGYRAEEVLGQPRSIIIPPERRDDFPDMLERLRRGEHIDHYETVRVRKGGQRIEMSISMSPVRDASGRIVGAAGIGRDITERKQGERERDHLLQREQQARRAAERAADHVARLQAATASLSEALTPAHVAAAMAEQSSAALGAESALIARLCDDGEQLEIISHLGFRSEQLRGWEHFPLSAAVPLAEVVRTMEPVWSESTAERIARYPHLAGGYANNPPGVWLSVPLVAHGRAIGGMSLRFPETPLLEEADKDLVLTLARQCALALERARLYDAESRARLQAQAAVQARDEFLSIAAHELRTPLTSLTAHAQLLERGIGRAGGLDQSQAKRSLQRIGQQADRLARLISQLLDISRLDAGRLRLEPQPTDLRRLVEGATAATQELTSQHQIRLRAPSKLEVVVDPFRLEQVLTNLLDNAIKYSRAGGVDVRLSSGADRAVEISVRDYGEGIPPEKREQIFERYYRAHKESHASGMGLGLYISRQIVELHGGELLAEFPEDGGTRFVIRLPLGAVTEPAGP